MDDKGTRYRNGDIYIQNGLIKAIGPNLGKQAEIEIDANGNAVLPGLINCHMHETLLRGLVEDLPLMRWLEEVCFPKDRAFLPQHEKAAAAMSQLEMIRGGTTTFVDIFRFPCEAAAVAEQSGLRGIFCPQVIDDPPGAGETLESNISFIDQWKDRIPGRIYTWFGPHAPYSCHKDTFQKMSKLAEKFDVRIHTHLAETKDEFDMFQEQYGQTPVEYLLDIELLSPRLSVAHGVYLTDRDIKLLAEYDVAVVYNPSSNMKLASGVARIVDLLEAGVRVGLGTDSNLSNNNLDMFEEMRLGAMLQKLCRGEAKALPCENILRMTTNLAAECLGLEDQIGSLEVGKRADVILVDLHAPHMWPIVPEPYSNVVEQIVYSANAADVLTTIVDGIVLMQDREVLTINQDDTEARVYQASIDLIKRAGLEERLEKIIRSR
ncbi:amidohydrolase [Chloroflexota bacterium]